MNVKNNKAEAGLMAEDLKEYKRLRNKIAKRMADLASERYDGDIDSIDIEIEYSKSFVVNNPKVGSIETIAYAVKFMVDNKSVKFILVNEEDLVSNEH